MRVILASASPRRRKLIENLKIEYETAAAGCEEVTVPGEHPSDTVKRLSEAKARWVAERCGADAVVIGADTVVAIDGKILGKPADENEAAEMLRLLSGKTHRVYTGLTVIGGGKTVSEYVETRVKFYDLTDSQIERYIATGEPMDKAGAYGIQKYGSLLVEEICGDYFNVVGLPVGRLDRILRNDFGIEPLI